MEFSISSKLLDTCVLGVLNNSDTYGYDLIQKMSVNINVSETALYPVLRRLSKDNLLRTYDKEYNGRNRKYYTITKEGRLKFKYYQEVWQEYKNSIDNIIEGGNINE